MIKSFFNCKIIATASAETVVIGLKLVDAEGHLLRSAGLALAIVSAMTLIICWAMHGKNEATTTAMPVKTASQRRYSRRNRSRVSRAD